MSDVKRFDVDCIGGVIVCRGGCYVLSDDYDALKTENESLRKDAERYRRMRAMTLAQTGDALDEFDSAFDSQLDAALGHGEKP